SPFADAFKKIDKTTCDAISVVFDAESKFSFKLSCKCFQIVERIRKIFAMERSTSRYFNYSRSPFRIVQRYSDMLASCTRETSRTNDVRLFQIEVTRRADDVHFVAF